MSNSEVESISNGLDRCTMLLQNILDQPNNNNNNTNEVYKVPVSTVRRMQKPKLQTKVSKPVGFKKKVISKKVATSRSKPNKIERKSAPSGRNVQPVKTTTFDKAIPSSTPLVTPIKKEKLVTPRSGKTPKVLEDEINELERPPARSNSNPPSISSSQCSLIELLHLYNTSQPKILSTSLQSGDQNISNKSEERTLTPTPDQNIEDKLETLQKENVALQRQLRAFKNESKVKINDTINLEVASLQCTNASLQKKVSDLSKALEQTINVQQEISDANSLLMEQNEKLQKEISTKNEELKKSGKLFTNETEQIKQDVGNALSKVEILRQSLNETNNENLKLVDELQTKDEEINRINQLNRGLQSSVSRLLQDLNKKSQPNQGGEKMSNFVLQQLGSLLSAPSQLKLNQSNNFKTQLNPKPSNSELFNQNSSDFTHPKFKVLNHDYPNLNQNNLGSKFNEFQPPMGHPSLNHPDPQVPGFHPNSFTFNPIKLSPRQNENYLILPPNKPQQNSRDLTPTNYPPTLSSATESSCYVTNGSVSSSMLSMTSQDENNFSLGLANLDADIRKLQDSMKEMTS